MRLQDFPLVRRQTIANESVRRCAVDEVPGAEIQIACVFLSVPAT